MLANIPNSQKITVMAGVILAMLLSALDQTIVATAMPRIVGELKGLEHLSWVFTAYMLASTVTVPIYGKLSDIYGRKWFFFGGIVIFILGSILSGLSQNMTQLILFRGLQGIGGGAMMANSFAIIGDLFPPAERGRWQGVLGGVFGLASVVGPTLGGWFTDNASWRWNFFINIPVGILALLAIGFLMPKVRSEIKDRSIDYLGAVTLILGLVPFLLALVWGGNQYAWGSFQEIGLFIISVIFISLFVVTEHFSKEPIIPLSLFKNRIFTVSVIITFLSAMGMFGAILYIPLFAQIVLGITATNSGTILTPLMFGLIIASVISGQIISKTGKYKYLAVFGMGVATAAIYWISTMSAATTQPELIIRMVVMGIGLGITMPIFNIAVQNAFDHSKLGVVTASTQLSRSLGGTVGVAILGSILNNALTKNLSGISNDPFIQTVSKVSPQFSVGNINANQLQGFLSSAGQEQIKVMMSKLPPQMQSQTMQYFSDFLMKMKDAFAGAITEIFFIGTILMGIAFIASLFLKEIPLRKSHTARPMLEEAGIEVAVEEGEFTPSSEPELRK